MACSWMAKSYPYFESGERLRWDLRGKKYCIEEQAKLRLVSSRRTYFFYFLYFCWIMHEKAHFPPGVFKHVNINFRHCLKGDQMYAYLDLYLYLLYGLMHTDHNYSQQRSILLLIFHKYCHVLVHSLFFATTHQKHYSKY